MLHSLQDAEPLGLTAADRGSIISSLFTAVIVGGKLSYGSRHSPYNNLHIYPLSLDGNFTASQENWCWNAMDAFSVSGANEVSRTHLLRP